MKIGDQILLVSEIFSISGFSWEKEKHYVCSVSSKGGAILKINFYGAYDKVKQEYAELVNEFSKHNELVII